MSFNTSIQYRTQPLKHKYRNAFANVFTPAFGVANKFKLDTCPKAVFFYCVCNGCLPLRPEFPLVVLSIAGLPIDLSFVVVVDKLGREFVVHRMAIAGHFRENYCCLNYSSFHTSQPFLSSVFQLKTNFTRKFNRKTSHATYNC